MKHLLLLVALALGVQPVLAGVNAPNGATLLALATLAIWARLVHKSSRRCGSVSNTSDIAGMPETLKGKP